MQLSMKVSSNISIGVLGLGEEKVEPENQRNGCECAVFWPRLSEVLIQELSCVDPSKAKVYLKL